MNIKAKATEKKEEIDERVEIQAEEEIALLRWQP